MRPANCPWHGGRDRLRARRGAVLRSESWRGPPKGIHLCRSKTSPCVRASRPQVACLRCVTSFKCTKSGPYPIASSGTFWREVSSQLLITKLVLNITLCLIDITLVSKSTSSVILCSSFEIDSQGGKLSKIFEGHETVESAQQYNPHLCIESRTSKLTNDDLFVATVITCITRIEEDRMTNLATHTGCDPWTHLIFTNLQNRRTKSV